MNRLERLAWFLRWPLVGLAGLWILVLVWWVLPPELGGAAGLVGVVGFIPIGPGGMILYYLLALNYVTVLLFSIRSFFPHGSPLVNRLANHAPPQRPMSLTVAMMAAALCTGAIVTLLEAMDNWATFIYSMQFTTLDTHLFRAGPGLAVAMLCWAIWIPIIHGAWRKGDRYQQTGVALTRLAFCAMLLLILAALVHGRAMAIHPEMLHQTFGSYTGLMLGASVLLWAWMAGAIRLLFKRDYLYVTADNISQVDARRLRGRMSLSFRMIYMSRRLLLVVTTLTLALVFWMLMTDILIRVPLGALALMHLEAWTGYWLLPDHGIRGILGIYPATRIAHFAMSATGLGLFLLSQALFEMPWRRVMDSLVKPGKLTLANAVGLAMPAAALTVGAVAMTMEYLELWSQFIRLTPQTVTERRYMGVIFQPTFWIALPTLLVAMAFWTTVFAMMKLPGTRFIQRAQILFLLFVAATAELFMAGMMQSLSYGYGGAFWDRGTFTAMCLGAGVTLWTLLPALRLIYAGHEYMAITAPLVESSPSLPDPLPTTPATEEK